MTICSMEKSELLLLARELIYYNMDSFVCNALMSLIDVYNLDGSNVAKVQELRCWITDALRCEDGEGSFGTVCGWLRDVHGISGNSQMLKEYRLAWIDNMIEYWRAQND